MVLQGVVGHKVRLAELHRRRHCECKQTNGRTENSNQRMVLRIPTRMMMMMASQPAAGIVETFPDQHRLPK